MDERVAAVTGLEIVQLDRGEGKTKLLLEWLKDAPEGEHRVLVSHTPEEAMRVYRSTRLDGEVSPFESWQFVGVQEIRPGAWAGVLYGRGGRVVLGIDNIDLVLEKLIGWPVGIVTATGSPAPVCPYCERPVHGEHRLTRVTGIPAHIGCGGMLR